MKVSTTAVCLVCGKEFEKNTHNHFYCSELCRVSAKHDIKQNPILPPELNLKIKDILNIMHNENIAYSQYAHSNESRRKYIEKYKEVQNNGIV